MKIANWAKFQGYEKKGPKWLKLHVGLINDPSWISLPMASRALLPTLWIVASSQGVDGELPDDLRLLSILCHLPQDEVLAGLQPLIDAGFILCDKTFALPATTVSGEKRREETEREKRESIPASPVPRTKTPSWSSEACDDFCTRYGGTAPGSRIGPALKPLVDKHGWQLVQIAWRYYLSQTDPGWADPYKFAQAYGKWSAGPAKPAVVMPPPVPRPLRERDDVPATREQIEAAKQRAV